MILSQVLADTSATVGSRVLTGAIGMPPATRWCPAAQGPGGPALLATLMSQANLAAAERRKTAAGGNAAARFAPVIFY